MKKTKSIIQWILILYIAWSCYDRFEHTDEHLSFIMEMLGAAGEESVKVAKGAIR